MTQDFLPDGNSRDYVGMTVLERLVDAALLSAFDEAVITCDRDLMVEILRRVHVGTPEATADAVLADPAKYGY